MKQKDTYDIGLESLRDEVRNFLKCSDRDPQQKRITEEMVTIAVAAICSMDRGLYEEIREEEVYEDGSHSKVKAKLSISVQLEDEIATATCSGNIKLKNEANVKIDDGSQLKLDLDGKGGKR